MKILIVGGGGREHALAWKLSQEADVIAAPGNPGIAECARCFGVPTTDHAGLIELAKAESVDLIVVGPEDPLVAGLADAMRDAGLTVFGPGKEGARLEGSKAFSKQLMKDAGIPTAGFGIFTDPLEAHAFVDQSRGKLVVKASGVALGKGVIVTDSGEEAHEAIDDILVEGAFGEAGRTIVIEERVAGKEFSLLTLCSDTGFYSLPVAQDYKRALDGDRGPNTGGMGSFSPVPWIPDALVRETEARVVEPILATLASRGTSYRGVLFSGLMVEDGRLNCLEFNVRFGDPEIQSIVMRLGKGFADALHACAIGAPIPPVEVLDNAAVTVVVASGGYPNQYEKGKPITIDSAAMSLTSLVSSPAVVHAFHAGTAMKDGALVTSGGRVAAISASSASLSTARDLAYDLVKDVDFEGKYFRKDIADFS